MCAGEQLWGRQRVNSANLHPALMSVATMSGTCSRRTHWPFEPVFGVPRPNNGLERACCRGGRPRWWRGVSPEITGAVGTFYSVEGLHGRTTRETPVALIHPDPAHNADGHLALYVTLAAVILAMVLLSALRPTRVGALRTSG